MPARRSCGEGGSLVTRLRSRSYGVAKARHFSSLARRSPAKAAPFSTFHFLLFFGLSTFLLASPAAHASGWNDGTARLDTRGEEMPVFDITSTGPGLILLTGNNTFSGTTTITGGTLEAGGVHALGATTSVTVNSGGTLLFSGATTDRINDNATINLNGGTLNIAGLSENTAGLSEGAAGSQGMGALTLASASTIDLGTAASIIAFANSNGTWTGTLRILNWSGSLGGNGTDQVYFGTDATGLGSTQLDQISFYSDAAGLNFLGTATILSDGEVVPMPEPSTWIGAGLALIGAGFMHRRRLARMISRRITS